MTNLLNIIFDILVYDNQAEGHNLVVYIFHMGIFVAMKYR